jgi:hypothetical protein
MPMATTPRLPTKPRKQLLPKVQILKSPVAGPGFFVGSRHLVIASEAKQSNLFAPRVAAMDCFAPLAKTTKA